MVNNSTNINKTNNQLLSHRTQRTNDGQQILPILTKQTINSYLTEHKEQMMVNNSTNINKTNNQLLSHRTQRKMIVNNSTNINKTNNQLLSHRTQRTNDSQQFYQY